MRSRDSSWWSVRVQTPAKIGCQKSYPSPSSIRPTVRLSIISFEKPSLNPRRIKNVARVTMKLGRPVRSTIVPLNQPSARATTREMGMATQRLNPAPPSSPTSLTNRMVMMASAPVAAPDERSNSPPIISSETATAMMPRVAATSRIDEAPPAVPNSRDTAQKNAQMAAAPTMAPISGRTNNRWKTPRYASRSSAPGAAALDVSESADVSLACASGIAVSAISLSPHVIP